MCLCLYSTTLIFEPILIALCENNSMCFLRGNDSSVSPLRILTCMGRLIQPNTLALLQLVYMPRGRTNVWTAFLVHSWVERQLSKFVRFFLNSHLHSYLLLFPRISIMPPNSRFIHLDEASICRFCGMRFVMRSTFSSLAPCTWKLLLSTYYMNAF